MDNIALQVLQTLSTISNQQSGPGTNPLEEIDFDSYKDQELLKLHEELSKRVQFLDIENTMFESYFVRVMPQMAAMGLTTGGANGQGGKEDDFLAFMQGSKLHATDDDRNKDAGGVRREKKKKGEKVKEVDKPITLTSEQKSEIATREIEELRDDIQEKKEEWGKMIDNYKAETEEVEIRMSELKKAMYEFKRDIVQQAVNPRTGKVIAERLIRYFEDKVRGKDAVIEKIRLKNVTLKVQKNKLHLQLKQKEEMGEVLHAIDFDQLQIENKQYVQKIEERNAELLKLKMTAGRTVQTLNFFKKKLSSLSNESEKLKSEIGARKDLLSKLVAEAAVVGKDHGKARVFNQWLLKQIDEYQVPDVMDYVLIKASQHELQKKLKGWERKVEIAAMQAQRTRKIWRQMAIEGELSTREAPFRSSSGKGQFKLPELPGAVQPSVSLQPQ